MDDPTRENPSAIMTLKQALFAEYYLGEARGNGTQAARLAGYAGTDHSLHVIASENLKKPPIAARIAARVAQAAMGADECLAELSAVARQPLHETLIVKRNGRDEVIEARFDVMGKVRALELLAKHHRLLGDREGDGTREEIVRILEYVKPAGVD